MYKGNVLVSGVGMVGPSGHTISENWENLKKGRCGIKKITKFDPNKFLFPARGSKLIPPYAGEVHNWDSIKIRNEMSRYSKKMSRKFKILSSYAQYGVYAVFSMLKKISGSTNCKLDFFNIPDEIKHQIGISYASAMGPHSQQSDTRIIGSRKPNTVKREPNEVIPVTGVLTSMLSSMGAFLSTMLGIKGPVEFSTSACASGSDAVGRAYEMIRLGKVQCVIIATGDPGVTPYVLQGFANMGAMYTGKLPPEKASRPFDKDRNGFVFAQGGGAMILATKEFAEKWGLPIIAEMIGYHNNSDGHDLTDPGQMQHVCMQKAIESAGIGPDDVSAYVAHGTSTPGNDGHEAGQIGIVFPSRIITTIGLKSMLGHGMGNAGMWGAIAAVKMLYEGIIIPTINCDNQDPECSNLRIHGQLVKYLLNIIMTGAFGFGGPNSVLLFQKYIK